MRAWPVGVLAVVLLGCQHAAPVKASTTSLDPSGNTIVEDPDFAMMLPGAWKALPRHPGGAIQYASLDGRELLTISMLWSEHSQSLERRRPMLHRMVELQREAMRQSVGDALVLSESDFHDSSDPPFARYVGTSPDFDGMVLVVVGEHRTAAVLLECHGVGPVEAATHGAFVLGSFRLATSALPRGT